MENKPSFKSVEPRVNFPELEEKILKFWKEKKIFEKSVESRPAGKIWNFLDGPPFITGLPHYGSLLSSIPKDLFPRFWTMKGYRVRRVWGWDCHGLPAENKVEVKLGIKRKKEIEEKIGVKKFIDECKQYVNRVSSEWEWYVDHIGRFVDFKNSYKTMDLPYMESVMWVFKQMYDKGFIYKGLRVSLYCPRCSTPISNFEVAMDPDNYTEITEPSTVYKYKVKGVENTYFLAWSTTPWNKLVTPALAVNPSVDYITVRQGGENYILAKAMLSLLKDKPYEVVEERKGSELLGKEFIPHYDFFAVEPGKKAFVVIGGDFVSGEEGTGIVTIAAYGEEDLAAMQKNNIQIVLHLNEEGNLLPSVPRWGGKYYLDVNDEVNADLEERHLVYREDPLTHAVPTCWRCHTRLYYAPQDAWYVDVQKLKAKMAQTNEQVNWFPPHFKHGRFLKSMEAAPDWCISRSRFWGSPVPVWECACGERLVPGSLAELSKLSGKTISDLHKPEIDKITVKCAKCGEAARRVPEVLDSWTEAGSAPYAERHYPFEPNLELDEFFPPDFVVEYTGQIRAWFYVLHVIATALFNSPAFKNVSVTGVILGTDGRKMSKNFGNYPDPREMLTTYGGDALRLYLMGSPVMNGEDIRISEEEYRLQVRTFLLIFWNVYNFFVTYANLDGWRKSDSPFAPKNVLDHWVLSRLQNLVASVTASLENYDTVRGVKELKLFVDDLSTWYVRRSRNRVGSEFYETLYTVLTTFCKVAAPFVPFVAEEIFKNLTGKESVHLEDWPAVDSSLINEGLEEEMALAREVVKKARALRKEYGIKVRQPVGKIWITGEKIFSREILEIVKDELNAKDIVYGERMEIDREITPELKAEGEARELIRQIQDLRKAALCRLDEVIEVEAPAWPKEFEELIKKETLTAKLKLGQQLKIVS